MTHIFDDKLRWAWRSYLWQSALATLAVIAILYVLNVTIHAAIVAALGASTFIVFAIPHNITAEPRRLIGGHAVGLAVGAFCHFAVLQPLLGGGGTFPYVLASALAVGMSIFLMVITNTEHPPAAGTALGLVAQPWGYLTVISVLGFAVLLSLARYLLAPRMRNLV